MFHETTTKHDKRHEIFAALNLCRHEDDIILFASVCLSVSGISQTVIDEV